MMPDQSAAGSGTAGGLREVRSKVCHRLLFKADGLARVEIVCPDRSCKRMQTVRLGDRRGR
jgi:phage FluMu protein Com